MAVIKTKKFILRPPRMSDAASLVKHLNDIKVSRNMSSVPHPYGLNDAKKWLKKYIKNTKKEALSLMIEIEKEAVGGITLGKIKQGHKAELGYWLGADGYYKPDVYIYYFLTFAIPLIAGYYKTKKGQDGSKAPSASSAV